MDTIFPIAAQLAGRYFGLGRGNSRRGRGRARRGRNRTRRAPRTPQRVPPRTILQGSFNGTIRQFYTVGSAKTYYNSLNAKSLLADAYASLASQFTEVRVHAIRVYYEPNAPTSQAGNYAACLFDGDAPSVTTPSYGKILASPGSICRKMYQSHGLHWKWTEASDSEFIRITDTSFTFCVYQMAVGGNDAGTNLGGDVIVDASITLRNQTGSLSDSLRNLIILDDFSSVEDDVLHDLASHCKQAITARSLDLSHLSVESDLSDQGDSHEAESYENLCVEVASKLSKTSSHTVPHE